MALLLVLLAGCRRTPPMPDDEPYQDEEQSAYIEEEGEPPQDPPPPAIAHERGARRGDDEAPEHVVVPASHGDEQWLTDTMETARRYVYRVRMMVPTGLSTGDDRISTPAAELFIDVAHERLRARFGTGWPVPAGSEVRLRRDRPGVYLYDGRGGRPLEPGALSAWFDGGAVSRRGPPLRIFGSYGFSRHEPVRPDVEAPGELVCAFLAEWGAEDPEAQMRRCERGAPRLWRIGFWRADQTAAVPMNRPRVAFRADERDPPPRIQHASRGAFLEGDALSRIEPNRGPTPEPGPDAPERGLRVENESTNRVVVAVQGVALGWVDSGRSITFEGLSAGTYELGTVRPMGAVVQRARDVAVPGVHRVCDGRCPRRAVAAVADPTPTENSTADAPEP
ncbi:MAG: hypothetical protein AB8I08_11065 [Sandaracinaceae bacterium]